ncbi:hypothetical protein [Variovorax rhizosphaerae]|uniref:HNH endonuclease n=1 Tax=Variovorax rhizosphaerae TaxID=1836200 RepID=A0ABU8WG93_9BURK
MTPMTAEQVVADTRARNLEELARGRQKLVELGESPAVIGLVMWRAETMLAEQVACIERRLGLADAVVVH